MQKQETKTSKNGSVEPPVAAMTAPAPEGTAIEVYDYGEDAGQGFENQSMADRKLPMIVVLQPLSPQVIDSKGKIAAGSLYNTVTGEVYDELEVVPAITDRCWLAFIPRDDGGGFKGRFQPDSKVVVDAIKRNEGRAIGKLPFPQLDKEGKPAKDEKGKLVPAQELVETFEVYVILADKRGEVVGFGVIPFSSSKIKVYRAWNTALAMFSPTINGKKIPAGVIPLFAHRVKITTESESNHKGTYFVPVLSPAAGGDDLMKSLLPKNDPRYLAAKKLHDDVKAGLAKAAYETMDQEPGTDPEGAAPF